MASPTTVGVRQLMRASGLLQPCRGQPGTHSLLAADSERGLLIFRRANVCIYTSHASGEFGFFNIVRQQWLHAHPCIIREDEFGESVFNPGALRRRRRFLTIPE